MATTRLSDLVVVPEVFGNSMNLQSLALDLFVQSGVVVGDPTLNAFLSSETGGETFSPRFLGPLDDTDPNMSTDDPAQKSTPEKIVGSKNTAVRQDMNKSWSSMDLSAMLYGSDPIAAIQSMIAKYWLTVRQKRTLSSLRGIIADNVASNSGDMVNNVSGGAGAASLFSPEAYIDAKATMGDRMSQLSALAVHSVVYSTMLKQDLIDYIKPSDDSLELIPTYQGARVLVDDGMTTTGSSPDVLYYSYLFGPGAIAMGTANARVPFEVDRNPEAGNGGGEEVLYSRVSAMIHPQGFQWTGPSGAGNPTMAELISAANWTRAWERKRIPLACLITKG